MGDFLCKIMGGIDIIAGCFIMYGFKFNFFSIVFGIIMLIKGLISLV